MRYGIAQMIFCQEDHLLNGPDTSSALRVWLWSTALAYNVREQLHDAKRAFFKEQSQGSKFLARVFTRQVALRLLC